MGLGTAVGSLSRILLLLFLSALLCGSAAAQLTGCPLNSPGGPISHIVYIQFDNLHIERDNPNVPSDLEQMPHLFNFLKNNGTVFANHHTPLISHTADDILTSLTGVYGDRHGQAVANSFVSRNQPSNKYWDSFPSSFTYWTDFVSIYSDSDMNYSMITDTGVNAPAPWVPFTRAGCNVGAVSIANMEFENTSTDINNVYGSTSPEATELPSKKVADFEGISIHCAANSTLCAAPPAGQVRGPGQYGAADVLPQEPGGYVGFNGIFGHKYVVPALIGSGQLDDLSGNPITGFPGFGGISPAQTLAYDATMLENGVPIVFSYISDAHDCHTVAPACVPSYRAFGPGEAGYVAQLKAYDTSFGQFFARLEADGIDSSNTLFVISADEQDHFVGGPAAPANCDGVNVPCTYTYGNGTLSSGEIEADLAQLYNQQFPALIPSASAATSGLAASAIFDYHYDMAPAVSLNFENPAVTPAFTRQLERATAQLTAVSPITGNTDQLTLYQVDNVGLKALHMITGDPDRTPTFVMFANTNYYFQGQGPIIQQSPGYAWNHGGVAPEINTTWVGFVGPGVRKNGIDYRTWTDETDIRPTILLLAGLQDDYVHDGRVLAEDLHERALPRSVRGDEFQDLAAVYKQLNATLGSFGQDTLDISTKALASGSATDDSKYQLLENQLSALTTQRDSIAAQIRTALDGAEFKGERLDPKCTSDLLWQAQEVLWKIALLAREKR
ncbi:MAG TPA: hypothetical protein VJY15_02360 [Candidatus Acidoferrum sp.]|nr:hypothetical protein [Candidatus Acidoferrum sp.]